MRRGDPPLGGGGTSQNAGSLVLQKSGGPGHRVPRRAASSVAGRGPDTGPLSGPHSSQQRADRCGMAAVLQAAISDRQSKRIDMANVELNPQPLPPGLTIRVHAPASVMFDLETFQRAQASVLKQSAILDARQV
jgi:hypothetical protein